MLHTVVRKYKTAEKCLYCENRVYSMFYVCHYSWLLTSISFPPFFVIVQPLLRCVAQKVAQSAQHNATRQNMLQHLYVFSSKCEKPKPHHDRLHCDVNSTRPGTDRMTVKFQHQHWNDISNSTEDSDDFHLQLGIRQTSLGLIHRRKLKALRKYSDEDIYVNVKEENLNILERQQNTNHENDDKL
jgi:hypothetical protein